MHPRLLNCALKAQEDLFLYNFRTDERYELDRESFEFLRRCTGRNTFEDIINEIQAKEEDGRELIDYLLGEGCIEDRRVDDAPESYSTQEAVLPSLRYLQLHITERCNLNCRHCYLGEKGQTDLDMGLIKKALREFAPGGLKVLITGGEPLLHRRFWEVVEYAGTLPIRVEVLSNGTLITEEVAERLSRHVHGLQISLDGMKRGHEYLRGKGSFERVLAGIENASRFMDVSIATMVHSGNLGEFEELDRLIGSMAVREWNLDIPSAAGNATDTIIPSYQVAARIFERHGFSSGVHEGDSGYSCGSHICTVHVDGGVSKCGFFHEPVGNIAEEGLMELWTRVVERYTPKVDALQCRGCNALHECRGGCRYRALVSGDLLGKDPFMCTVHLGE